MLFLRNYYVTLNPYRISIRILLYHLMYFNSFFLYPISCTLSCILQPCTLKSCIQYLCSPIFYILYLFTLTFCILYLYIPLSCISALKHAVSLFQCSVYRITLYHASLNFNILYPVSLYSIFCFPVTSVLCPVSCIPFSVCNFSTPIFCIQYLY